MDLAEIRKRAMYDPQSLSESEWGQIHEATFTVPKQESSDENKTKASPVHLKRRRRKGDGDMPAAILLCNFHCT